MLAIIVQAMGLNTEGSATFSPAAGKYLAAGSIDKKRTMLQYPVSIMNREKKASAALNANFKIVETKQRAVLFHASLLDRFFFVKYFYVFVHLEEMNELGI